MNKSNLLYWFPKIKDLEIPVPKTKTLELNPKNDDLISIFDGNSQPLDSQMERILNKTKEIGYPLFMKTGEFSGKHYWKTTCYVEKEENLRRQIVNLIEMSLCADITDNLPIDALVFREYIPMKTLFTGFFGETPINPEFRFFINNGKVQCGHWYWVEDAIAIAEHRLPKGWRVPLRYAKDFYSSKEHIFLLTQHAQKIADVLPDHWSIDFCLSKDDKWYLIDMALGEVSEHLSCPETYILKYDLKS